MHRPVPNYAQLALERFDNLALTEAIAYGDRRLSYAELAAGVRGIAAALRECGTGPGAAVAVLAGSRPESVMTQLALHLLGCRSVWIAALQPPQLSAEFLALAEVDALVYDARAYQELGARLAAGAPAMDVFCIGPGGAGPDLTAELPTARRGSLRHPAGAPGPAEEPCSLYQTGGTTGRPKLVRHGHDFFTNLHTSASSYLEGDGHPPRSLAVSGFWHPSSQAASLLTLFAGGLLVQLESFDPATFLATIEAERVTATSLPPARVCQVLDHPGLDAADTRSLVTLACAGSPMAPSRVAEAMRRFGPAVMIAYGMTEATLIAAYPTAQHDPAQPQRLASCGRPVPTSRVEIRDEGGQVRHQGEVGEIWASARLMTTGYWGQPELTAQTLVDGWLRTGDLGYLDVDGYLYLVDRAKDMIVTGLTATNVYSRNVEDVLVAHPQVRAAAVIGVPHEAYGEAVHAVVELTPDATMPAAEAPDQLRAWVASQLNELWAPASVEVVAALPLTGSAKVDKQALRARYAARS